MTLFDAVPGRMTRDAIGRRIVEQASAGAGGGRRRRGQLASQNPGRSGRDAAAGVIYTIGPYLLPHLIPRLHRRAPDMPLQIEEGFYGAAGQAAQGLKRSGRVDSVAAVRRTGVMTQAVYEEPFVVVLMPLGHPAGSGDASRYRHPGPAGSAAAGSLAIVPATRCCGLPECNQLSNDLGQRKEPWRQLVETSSG